MRTFKKFDLLVQIPFLIMLLEKMYRVFIQDDKTIFYGLWMPLLILVVWQFTSQLLHLWWGYTYLFKWHFFRKSTAIFILSWLVCVGMFMTWGGDFQIAEYLFWFAQFNIFLNISLLIFEISQMDKFLIQIH